jgi:hypothetical protein
MAGMSMVDRSSGRENSRRKSLVAPGKPSVVEVSCMDMGKRKGGRTVGDAARTHVSAIGIIALLAHHDNDLRIRGESRICQDLRRGRAPCTIRAHVRERGSEVAIPYQRVLDAWEPDLQVKDAGFLAAVGTEEDQVLEGLGRGGVVADAVERACVGALGGIVGGGHVEGDLVDVHGTAEVKREL